MSHPKVRCLFLLLALSLCPALVSGALADEVDLFQDLDTAMAETKAQEPRGEDGSPGAQLKDNLDLSARLRGWHFIQAEGSGDGLTRDSQDTLAEIKLDYATSYATERFRFNTSGWFEGGNQADTYNGVTQFFQDTDRRRNVWEINELYGVVDFGDVELTAGRKLLQNGISPLVSPANRYSAMDLNDPMDPRRLGVWQTAVDWTTGDTTWTFAALPFFITPKTPSTQSRWISGDEWAGIPGYFGGSEAMYQEFQQWLYFFSDLSGLDLVSLFERFFGIDFGGNTPLITTAYDRPDPDDPGEWGWFGRGKTSVGNWDLFASGYHGPSVYPVLKAKVDLSAPSVLVTVEHPIVDQVAGGASTTWKELEFHGEGLLSMAEDGKDDSYVQYVGGSTWSNQSFARELGMHRVDVTVDYVREDIVDRQSADGYFISSENARLGRDDVVGRLDLHLTEDVSVQWLTDILLYNSACMNRAGVTWRVAQGLVWTAAVEMFDGPGASYYGRWRDQDRVVTTMEYSF